MLAPHQGEDSGGALPDVDSRGEGVLSVERVSVFLQGGEEVSYWSWRLLEELWSRQISYHRCIAHGERITAPSCWVAGITGVGETSRTEIANLG